MIFSYPVQNLTIFSIESFSSSEDFPITLHQPGIVLDWFWFIISVMRNDIFAAVDEEVAHLNIPSCTQRNITLVSHQVQIPIEKGQCLINIITKPLYHFRRNDRYDKIWAIFMTWVFTCTWIITKYCLRWSTVRKNWMIQHRNVCGWRLA